MNKFFHAVLALIVAFALSAQTEPSPAPPPSPATSTSSTPEPAPAPPPKPGVLTAREIRDFDKNSPAVQHLITNALALAARQLEYKMGSADPDKGGMDCSGTMYYLLRSEGFKDIPRQSDQQYRWAWEAGAFIAVNGIGEKTFELSLLRPGYLLFWTGTYDVGDRNPPVSHVMLYLGKRDSDGKAIMFGGSDGRTYNGKPSWGIGVFDFRMPSAKSATRFIGYARIPGLDYSIPAEPPAKPAP